MPYNLTANQKALLCWFVGANRRGDLADTFFIKWRREFGWLWKGFTGGRRPRRPSFRAADIHALAAERLVTTSASHGLDQNSVVYEAWRKCSILQHGYDAVDNDFDVPHDSLFRFVRSPDLEDDELRDKCLPLLTGERPRFDQIVKTAIEVVEHRLRKAGKIRSRKMQGTDLVNAVLGRGGVLGQQRPGDHDGEAFRHLVVGALGGRHLAMCTMPPRPRDAVALLRLCDLTLRVIDDLAYAHAHRRPRKRA